MKILKDYSDDELEQFIRVEHCEKKISLRELARRLETYPVRLFRFCNKRNIPVLTKSESLKATHDAGRAHCHMKGKKLSEEEKRKMGERQKEHWDSLPEEEKERRRQVHRDLYEKRTDKEEFSRKGARAIKQASIHGSKAEHALAEKFKEHGVEFRHHYKDLILDSNLEVDFYLPEFNCVVEIDGPSHFTNNFGIDNHKGQLAADAKKNAVVLRMGASIIRMQHMRTLYKRDHHNMFEELMRVLPTLDNELKVINVENL